MERRDKPKGRRNHGHDWEQPRITPDGIDVLPYQDFVERLWSDQLF
jgi:hypothetical protein